MPERTPPAPRTDRPFDYEPRTRVVYGAGTMDRLGELAKAAGAKKVLLVTDAGLWAAGHPERGLTLLQEAGLDVSVFAEVQPNPTTEDVAKGLEIAKAKSVDFLVAIGGGSSMDCAKGINFLYTNGGKIQDYWGVGKATRPMIPLIAIPTTSGTGSEAQSFALISDAVTHAKMACGDKKAACLAAILDPELTVSMPAGVTAATGIDAISHALETHVTTRRNPVSKMFSRQAWELLHAGFPRVLENPADVEARGAMLLGAHWAGAAIENSMLGATHALANPLTAHFGLTHGLAIGVMLPHVLRYNFTACEAEYHELAVAAGLVEHGRHSSVSLADWVETQVARAGCPTDLAACDVDRHLIPQLAKEAAEQWTGTFNPRPVNASTLEELYQCAWSASA